MRRATALIFVILATCCAPWVKAEPAYITFPSDVDWVTKSSDHFQALFPRSQENLADRALKAAERAHSLLAPIFPESPEQTWIVLADFQASLNGYALDFPYPHMVVFTTPPDATGQLAPLDDWLSSVILHEYVHVLHMYPAHGLWRILRAIFGTGVVPNGLMPSHFHEGLATLMETEFTKGGRGRGSTFKMYRRMAVEDGVWGKSFAPLDLLDGCTTRWPHGSSAYFLGYEFYKELWSRKKGPGIRQYVLDTSESWPYLFNWPLRRVYAQDQPGLWKSIFEKGQATEKENLRNIKKQPLSVLKSVTSDQFSKWNLVFSPNAKAVAFKASSPELGGRIEMRSFPDGSLLESIALNGGRQEGLCWVTGDKSEYLVFIDTSFRNGHEEAGIRMYSLQNKTLATLSRKGETLLDVRNLACSSDGERLVVYQERGGLGRILDLAVNPENPDTFEEVRRFELPEGTWVSSLSVEDQIHWVLRVSTESHLYSWVKHSDPELEVKVPGHAHNLRVEKAGIHWIWDRDERDEVWYLPAGSSSAQKRIAVLGGVSGFDRKENQWAVLNYRHGGFDVAEATPMQGDLAKLPIPKTKQSRSTTSEAKTLEDTPDNPTQAFTETTEYSPWSTLIPRAWVPNLLFVPDGAQFGAWIPGFDIAQKNLYDVFLGYDTRGSPFGSAGYTRRFGGSWALDIDGYFSPNYIISNKTFLKRWGTSLGLSTVITGLVTNGLRVRISPIFRRLEPSRFGGANQSVGAGIGLSYGFGFQRRPLDVSPQKGTRLSLNYEIFRKELGSNDNYFNVVGVAEQFFTAPWTDQHFFYLAFNAGYTEGTSFINSFFQAGGELLFQQGRGAFLNRGFYPGTFLGRRVANWNLEYRFPILRVDRGFDSWPLFLQNIHGALVADATTVDAGARSVYKDFFRVFYASTGIELKTDWKFSYYLPTQIRLGAYHGFGQYGQAFYGTLGVTAGL